MWEAGKGEVPVIDIRDKPRYVDISLAVVILMNVRVCVCFFFSYKKSTKYGHSTLISLSIKIE